MDTYLKEKIPILKNPKAQLGIKVSILNEDPPIARIDNLLTPWECQHIIDLARPQLSDSTIIVDNKEIVSPNGRSSRSAYLTKSGQTPADDIVIYRFLNRLSELIDVPISQFEGMKVVNYQYQQEYKAHFDYFQNHDNFTKGIGDRMYTFFVYLNTLEEEQGGYTEFPKLNIRVSPQAGTGIFWVNLRDSPERHYYQETLHAGTPVLDSKVEKWGVNIWIRENPY